MSKTGNKFPQGRQHISPPPLIIIKSTYFPSLSVTYTKMDRSDNENTTPTHTINPWCEHNAIFFKWGGGGSSPIFENDATCLKSHGTWKYSIFRNLSPSKTYWQNGKSLYHFMFESRNRFAGGVGWRDNFFYIQLINFSGGGCPNPLQIRPCISFDH